MKNREKISSAICILFLFCISCRAKERGFSAEAKQRNSSDFNIDENSRLGGATFGDGAEMDTDSTGGDSSGDFSGGNGNNCLTLEHIDDTFGVSSLFSKRGDRTLVVYVPLPDSMKSWNTSPPSDGDVRKMIFGNRVSPKRGVVAPVAPATFKTTSDSGAGDIPAQTSIDGKTYKIHSNGEFGTEDCPKKTITEEGMRSPLIVDFSGEGLLVSSVFAGVSFDIAGNGAEQVAWPQFTNDTPWLVFDMDLDGSIEGIDELFGDQTKSRDQRGFENGFAALAIYDENHDNKIDQNDAIFSKLQFWRDVNRDGVSDPGELESFASRVRSLSLQYVNQFEQDDVHGNMSRQRSILIGRDGKEYVVYDLWLATQYNKS